MLLLYQYIKFKYCDLKKNEIKYSNTYLLINLLYILIFLFINVITTVLETLDSLDKFEL